MEECQSGFNRVLERLEEVEENLAEKILVVDSRVEQVVDAQRTTQDRVDELYSEFSSFVLADRRAKELQRALTELVRVRQELDKRFGHYDKVRMAAVGILQATSLDLVRKNTMHEMAEEMMAGTARYWLPPALLSLSAWIGDDRSLADRGMREAVRRDGRKASLFFALVCRRAGRGEAAAKWLSRYLANQDPRAIEREVVVMLDALAYGVFGGEALNVCSDVIELWLAELERQPGFSEEQRGRWSERLDIMAPTPGDHEYPTLRYSPTAPRLFASLSAVRRNQVVLDYFAELFRGVLVVPPKIEEAVDSLLDSLLTHFDDEELPLRREERLLQIVKEEEGDRARAENRFAAEVEAHHETLSFAALLTSAAMNPEQVSATRATQRYSVSRSRQWILAAHASLVARDRDAVPAEADLVVGSWQGRSVDGTNRAELLADLRQHYENRASAAAATVKLSAAAWIVLVAGAILGSTFMAAGGGAIITGILCLGAAIAFFAWRRHDLDRLRVEARAKVEKEGEQAITFLTACLSELAAYRRELVVEDAKAQSVADFLGALGEPWFILQGPDPNEWAA